MRHLTGLHLPKQLIHSSLTRNPDTLLATLIPLAVLLHLVLSPYSKVEESFNLQAAHDILTYGFPIAQVERNLRDQYDHLTFTGPVPRTFVGPLALAAVAWPGAGLVEGVNRQILGRLGRCWAGWRRCLLGIFFLGKRGRRGRIRMRMKLLMKEICSQGRAGIVQRFLPAFVPQWCAQSIRTERCQLVRRLPGRTVPPDVLRFAHPAQFLCFRSQCVPALP